jgi:hypothetical protein
LLTSRDIRLNACKLDNSLAISAGEEGDEPSSSSSRPDNGIFVAILGGGDGGRNTGREDFGLFRSEGVGLRGGAKSLSFTAEEGESLVALKLDEVCVEDVVDVFELV